MLSAIDQQIPGDNAPFTRCAITALRSVLETQDPPLNVKRQSLCTELGCVRRRRQSGDWM